MLSALVRNRTGKAVRARVSISLKDGCLELLPADDPAVKGFPQIRIIPPCGKWTFLPRGR